MTREAIKRLEAHNIRPSAQRISIMEYLLTHRTHPTVDTIYNDLVEKMPTLSKTTIYNTLKLLEEQKAIMELTIDKKTVHYDGMTMPHSHFMCKKCGKIIDIPLPEMDCEKKDCDYVVDEAEVYYRGYCKDCMESENQ